MPTRHWDSGQFGARAIAETLFGHNNPGGKLPYTFYKSSFISKISMDEFGCAKPPGTTLAQCCWPARSSTVLLASAALIPELVPI